MMSMAQFVLTVLMVSVTGMSFAVASAAYKSGTLTRGEMMWASIHTLLYLLLVATIGWYAPLVWTIAATVMFVGTKNNPIRFGAQIIVFGVAYMYYVLVEK